MKRYPEDAWERAMKVQEVILRAMAKRITWWQAAEILGTSVRSMRRWRALRELGIQMIAAYSPQGRGRMERSFKTWQGRLPQELRLAGMQTVEEANRFLREHYTGEFNRRFTVPGAERGHAFLQVHGQDLAGC